MEGPTHALTQPLRRPWLGLLVASALAVAWRVPFIRLPVTTDEAGYVTVAQLWANGGRLYRTVWVDRPQGLLLVFRLLARVGATPTVLRIAAVVAGVLLVLLVAATARELGGRRLGVTAAIIAGALGCSPFLQSFTLSGELLAALPAVGCAFCAVRWLNTTRERWLLAAGLLLACAVLVKQSAFDSGAALALSILWRRPRLRPLAVLAASTAVPVAVAVLTAPSAGDWWFAVVAYRFHGEGGVPGVSSLGWPSIVATVVPLAKGLGPLLLVALAALRATPRFVRIWTATAAAGALGGGLFHAHYFIELVPPLSIAGAYAVNRAGSGRTVAALASMVAVATVVPALGAPTRRQVGLIFPHDLHLASDAAVARTVEDVSQRRSTMLVLPPTASIAYLAHRAPAIPYLWARNVETIRAAATAERNAILQRLPATIVVERQAGFLPAVGLTMAAISRYYRPIVKANGAIVYRLRG